MTNKNNATFLQMPDLVIEVVLPYLNLEDLLSLRLLCKTSHLWVNSRPKMMDNLQLTVRNEETLSSVTKSTSSSSSQLIPCCFNNFKFDWESAFTMPRVLPKFLRKFSLTITTFDFLKSSCDDHYSRNDSIVEILLACPNIKCLKICELSCRKLTSKKDGLKTLIGNWKGLKSLQISRMVCNKYQGVQIFNEILMTLQNLVELNPPLITLSSPDFLSFNYKQCFKAYVIRPIMDYLQLRQITIQRENGGSNLKKLHIQEYLFDNDPNLLFEIAEICYFTNTILYPETFLPFSSSLFLQLPEEKRDVLKILGNFGGINDTVLRMAEAETEEDSLKNLECLSISFRSFMLSGAALEVQNYGEVMRFPKLKSVEVEMTNDPPSWNGRPSELSRFMKKFCSLRRDTVVRLNLMEVSRAKDTTMIKAVDLVKGFPNLSKLEVTYWDGESKQFLILWMGLKSLKEVGLRFCPNLRDDGIIGEIKSNSPMLGLKWLKVLTLSDCGTITDQSYILVFRHLRLRKFVHYSLSGSAVTKVGYNALGKGVFRHYIQEMMIHCTSEFKEMDQFCDYLRQFPKLRKPRWENYYNTFQESITQEDGNFFNFENVHNPHRSSRTGNENQGCCSIC